MLQQKLTIKKSYFCTATAMHHYSHINGQEKGKKMMLKSMEETYALS